MKMNVFYRLFPAVCAVFSAMMFSANAETLVGTDSWAGRRSRLAVVNPAVPADDGSVMSLDGEWEFAAFRHALESRDLQYELEKDFWGRDGVWKNVRKINVPGCWEAQGVGEEGRSYGYNSRPSKEKKLRHAHLGNGFYRRVFTVPKSWTGRRLWLKIGQLRTWGWVWIDGKAVAHVAEAHRSLKWEISDLVTPGKTSTIVVQVDNSYPFRNSQTLSFARWGGVTRSIEIEASGETFIDEAWVRGDYDGRCAEVHVALEGDCRGAKLNVELEGKRVSVSPEPGENIVKVPLGVFRPWSPERPNLYTARVELVKGDTVSRRYERFGVRKFEVRGKEFYLNGKPFFVRGYGDDYTYPITGVSPADKRYHLANFRKAKAAGFNFVRLHTHCEQPEYFDAADEAGVMVQPELSYNCDESSVETFSFDPVGDARAVWEGYRRHPSFAVYSGGNEGTLGPNGGRALFNWVHRNDPDRLVIEQDGGTYFRGHDPATSDFTSGPMSMWERGSFNTRAFICHEYGNVAVKGDARMEGDYTGAWLPRMTEKMRRENLSPAGLGDGWGCLLQDAQHDFQRMWIRRSVEAARKDPFCDGYSLWTIVDYTHDEKPSNTVNCQGVFDPFWRVKRHGTTPESLREVNSATAILLDTENRVREYRQNDDPLLCCGSLQRLVIDETNRVFCVGEKIPAQFILSHYGEEPIRNGALEWSLAADGKPLDGGKVDLGDRAPGPASELVRLHIPAPEVGRPVKAVLTAKVYGSSAPQPLAVNAWNFWIFPRFDAPSLPPSITVAEYGSSRADEARRTGRNLLVLGKRGGKRDIYPGWWSISWRKKGLVQNGIAARRHKLWNRMPYEPFLTPLLFDIIGEASALPVEGFSEKDFIMVGEGNTDFKLYLAAKVRPDGGREVFVSGLDVFSNRPQAQALLNDIVEWMLH